MKRGIVLLFIVGMVFSGCARSLVQGEFAGSTYGMTSKNADWIVVSQSGGEIMDVWIVKDSIVASAQESDGWIFVAGDGTPTAIGGDVKVLRVKDVEMFQRYHEYHMEFETKTYRELYASDARVSE